MKLINLTGMRFGRLVVADRDAGRRSRRRSLVYWNCLCDCGNRKSIVSWSLVSGVSASCGCEQFTKLIDHNKKKLIDLNGRVFGSLTVMARTKSNKRGPVWVCRCVCGKTSHVNAGALLSGNTSSCGCVFYHEVPLGYTSGLLTVVQKVTSDGKKLEVKWKCLCKCGNIKVVGGYEIFHRTVISCGCYKNRKVPLLPIEIRLRGRARLHKRRVLARGAGGAFTQPDIEDLLSSQRGRCANPACPTPRKSIRKSYEIDHYNPVVPRNPDNSPGSSDIGNIQLLCGRCNKQKSNKDPFVWARENGYLL